MYLKSLEMLGFKSFVDLTKLEFPRGFTAIVGPNGCGKSNISDAIRWVIGEQSSKTLRGTKMVDLIFNGSETRKALGMAEVSMTIANLPKTLPNSAIPVLEEARVTRRFFRSGESEYFINKVPCRLRDIIDLFLDTGISARAFSIIEQGQILQIINSKPVDRRFIIEEAAGIMKFKHRKNEALRKMAAAQDNLVRVNDTIIELRRQLGSLKRQASKAEAFKNKKSELKDLTLSLYSMDYRQYRDGLGAVSNELEALLGEKNHLETEQNTFNADIETQKIDVDFKEKEINNLKQEGFEIEGLIKREDAKIDLMKKQIEEVIEDRGRAKEEIAQLEEEIQTTSQDLGFRRNELDEASADIESLEVTFEEKNEGLKNIKSELDQAKSRVNSLESECRELDKKISADEHKRVSTQAQLEFLMEREKKIHADELELSRHLDETKQKEIEARERFERIARDIAIKKEKQQDVIAGLEQNRGELKEIEVDFERVKETRSTLNAKLASLMEFQKNFEGFQEGARNILMSREAHGKPEGILSVLADTIETTPEYEVAIETALGTRLQGLVMENNQTSLEAIEYLKTKKSGRSTFIPLSPRKVHDSIIPPNAEGIIGKAVDLVKSEPKYRDMINYILGDVVIVENAEKALSAWNMNGTKCFFVTLEGDTLDPLGIFTGGSPAKADSSYLRKKRIIGELQSGLSAQTKEMEDIENKLREKRLAIAGLEEKKSAIDEAILAGDRQYIHDEKDLSQIRETVEKDRQRLETCQEEVKNIFSDRERLKNEADSAEQELNILKADKEKLDHEISSAKELAANLHESLDSAKEETNEFNLKLVSLRGRKENIVLDMDRLVANKTNLAERIERRAQNHEASEKKKTQLEQSIESIEKEIIELSEKHRASRTALIEKEEAMKDLVASLNLLEDKAKDLSYKLEMIRNNIQEQELKKAGLNHKTDTLAQRIKDDFDAPIDEILNEYTDEIDKEEFSQKITALKDQISRFGDVNLGALEEYNVVNERFEFMDGQYKDLTESIANLHKAIEKINKTTSSRFMETFEKVSENFKMNFRRLFAGGRAELILTEPGNPLETGIDIIVQPPGKRPQNIIMLSAGEKAMTALSVLFSVFMVKPSPFCLLDEVDAPLDEANIHRFKEILRELSDKTQFITITHNQMTMTFSETLYGVTMEEKGVSKVVSVNLKNPGHFESESGQSKEENPAADESAEKKEESPNVAETEECKEEAPGILETELSEVLALDKGEQEPAAVESGEQKAPPAVTGAELSEFLTLKEGDVEEGSNVHFAVLTKETGDTEKTRVGNGSNGGNGTAMN